MAYEAEWDKNCLDFTFDFFDGVLWDCCLAYRSKSLSLVMEFLALRCFSENLGGIMASSLAFASKNVSGCIVNCFIDFLDASILTALGTGTLGGTGCLVMLIGCFLVYLAPAPLTWI